MLEKVRELIGAGYKEIVLTGIRLGRYGLDIGSSLSQLLKSLLNIPGEVRFRLSSIDPQEISSELIRIMASEERICPHLHIPLQSGSQKILKAMGRPYSPEEFIEVVETAKSNIPRLAFTTDVLVGFPGETEDDFEETLKVLEVTKPSRVHVFMFSPRPGTKAASFPERVPVSVKRYRSKLVQELSSRLFLKYARGFLGKTLTVLVETREENICEGTSENYLKVRFESKDSKIGELERVKLTEVVEGEIRGEIERGKDRCQKSASFAK